MNATEEKLTCLCRFGAKSSRRAAYGDARCSITLA